MSFKELLQKDITDLNIEDFMPYFLGYQRYFYVFFILLVTVSLYFFEVKTNVDSYFTELSLQRKYEKLLKNKEKNTLNRSSIESEIKRLKLLVEERETIFFSKNDFNEFSINILPKIATVYGGKIRSVVYGKTTRKDNFVVYQLNLTIDGDFQSIINILNEIESFSKVIRVDSLNMVLKKVDPLIIGSDLTLSLYGVDR